MRRAALAAPALPACGLAALFAACGAAPPAGLVDGVLVLPHELREVSAIVAVDADTVACVQDEVGALFFVSLSGGAPPRKVVFGPRGDYEGLARVGAAWWVLRSDGTLLELVADGDRLRIARTVVLPRGYSDWEGLCFDPTAPRLLVMPKDRADGDRVARDARPVFAVDPVLGVVTPAPIVVYQRTALIDQAEARGIALPTRTTDKGRQRVVLELAVSDLVVRPDARELLLVSAPDHLLLRVDLDGRLLAARALDPELLPQAEGLSFLPDGRLLVASEGAGGVGRFVVVPLP